MFHVWPPSHHSRRPGISVSLVSQWFLWGVPFVWYICFLVLPLLLQVAHGQQTSPIGATDVRLYTPASVLGKVDVHVGSIAGRHLDWQAWRTNFAARRTRIQQRVPERCASTRTYTRQKHVHMQRQRRRGARATQARLHENCGTRTSPAVHAVPRKRQVQ